MLKDFSYVYKKLFTLYALAVRTHTHTRILRTTYAHIAVYIYTGLPRTNNDLLYPFRMLLKSDSSSARIVRAERHLELKRQDIGMNKLFVKNVYKTEYILSDARHIDTRAYTYTSIYMYVRN